MGLKELYILHTIDGEEFGEADSDQERCLCTYINLS